MKRPTTFNLRIEAELKRAAEKAAAADKRSLAGLIVKLLTDHCEQQGYLKPGRKERKS